MILGPLFGYLFDKDVLSLSVLMISVSKPFGLCRARKVPPSGATRYRLVRFQLNRAMNSAYLLPSIGWYLAYAD